MRIKSLSLLLCLCLFATCLFSCKERDREYNEKEVTAAAKELIEKSLILNKIYWGEGIAFIPPEDGAEPRGYRPVDPEALALLERDYGIKDLKTLKEKTRKIFSEAGYNWIVSTCLTNINSDDGVASYARYYQSVPSEENGMKQTLMVYANARNIFENTESVEYLYDNMKVSDVEGQVLTVSLRVKTVGKDKTEKTRTFFVRVIEEADGYRLHGASYATHN